MTLYQAALDLVRAQDQARELAQAGKLDREAIWELRARQADFDRQRQKILQKSSVRL